MLEASAAGGSCRTLIFQVFITILRVILVLGVAQSPPLLFSEFQILHSLVVNFVDEQKGSLTPAIDDLQSSYIEHSCSNNPPIESRSEIAFAFNTSSLAKMTRSSGNGYNGVGGFPGGATYWDDRRDVKRHDGGFGTVYESHVLWCCLMG